MKLALIACNEFYKSETGLSDLPQTKDDLSSILETTTMMGIEKENTFVLVDTSWELIEKEWKRLKLRIEPFTMKLSINTGIGGIDYAMGIPWKRLIDPVFDLINEGEIKVS